MTEKPWRSRWFSIENKEDIDDKFGEDDEIDIKKSSAEFNDSTDKNDNEQLDLQIKRKNGQYFIYRSATETWRKTNTLNNSLIGKDALYTRRSNDAKKGGKEEGDKDQENILEKDSFTNKVYHEIANLSFR